MLAITTAFPCPTDLSSKEKTMRGNKTLQIQEGLYGGAGPDLVGDV